MTQSQAGVQSIQEIEITSHMVEAGQMALVRWEDGDDPYSASCVKSIYQAMEAARQKLDQ